MEVDGSAADNVKPDVTDSADPPATPTVVKSDLNTPISGGTRKKARLSSTGSGNNAKTPSPADAAALAQLNPQLLNHGWYGLASLISSVPPAMAGVKTGKRGPTSTSPGVFPTPAQVHTAATKFHQDNPPWVHWSKTDLASSNSFKFDAQRLQITGAITSGYRMARANVGVSQGAYYYEARLLPGPTATEVLNSLPSNVRLGPGLQSKLEKAASGNGDSTNIAGHVRIGWSMRTGELQAPVGYDQWSYGIRSMNGSIIHKSQRIDDWGGDNFGPNDIFGCAIIFTDEPHIRFFKNGENLGHFVIVKGKRTGGEAYSIQDHIGSTFYPAVSTYLGGGVQVNFGPHFIYPPRKLPSGIKLEPMCSANTTPLTPEEATKTVAQMSVAKHSASVIEAVEVEAKIVRDLYDNFHQQQIKMVRQAREERGLSTSDLPSEA